MSRGQTSAAFGEFAIERAPPSWCKPGYRTELLCGMIKLDECIVDIAPAPTLRRIVTFDDRMPSSMIMLRGVPARRLIAAADMPTSATDPEVDPGVALFQTLFAPQRARGHIANAV